MCANSITPFEQLYFVTLILDNKQCNSNFLLRFFSNWAKSLYKGTPHPSPDTFEITRVSIYLFNMREQNGTFLYTECMMSKKLIIRHCLPNKSVSGQVARIAQENQQSGSDSRTRTRSQTHINIFEFSTKKSNPVAITAPP